MYSAQSFVLELSLTWISTQVPNVWCKIKIIFIVLIAFKNWTSSTLLFASVPLFLPLTRTLADHFLPFVYVHCVTPCFLWWMWENEGEMSCSLFFLLWFRSLLCVCVCTSFVSSHMFVCLFFHLNSRSEDDVLQIRSRSVLMTGSQRWGPGSGWRAVNESRTIGFVIFFTDDGDAVTDVVMKLRRLNVSIVRFTGERTDLLTCGRVREEGRKS